ncbi:hypothetical protein ACMXYN_05670 [Neptuniibacter sp. PT8_73]|uniref:hypothetical protein n=1 Tax=Neptuniibacter sp. PT8_73 TaxID=3398206 RepID=UPI0039F55C7F
MNKKIDVSSDMHNLLQGIFHDRLTEQGIIFSYICAKAFNIVRYPWTPDRSIDCESVNSLKATETINSFGVEKISDLVEEIKDIKNKTRDILIEEHQGKQHIILKRALSPLADEQYLTAVRRYDKPEVFPMLAMAAQKAGIASFKIDVDIVSGWSTRSDNRYGSLHVKKSWDINDIIIVSDYMNGFNSEIGALESNEWLCLNRNENGLVELNTDECHIDKNLLPRKYIKKIESSPNLNILAEKLQQETLNQSSLRSLPAPIFFNLNSPKLEFGLVEKLKILFFSGN